MDERDSTGLECHAFLSSRTTTTLYSTSVYFDHISCLFTPFLLESSRKFWKLKDVDRPVFYLSYKDGCLFLHLTPVF